MPIPLLGLAVGALGSAAKKLAGKALSAATKGKLLGSGGGKELLKTAAKGAVATVGGAVLTSRVNQAMTPYGPASLPSVGPDDGIRRVKGWTGSGWARPRRMNPMNVRALRKAVRRIGSAEKLLKSIFTISGGKVTVRTKRRGR